MTVEVLYVGNDNLLKVSALYDNSAGEYVNDATVAVTLLDRDDNEVSGAGWPLSLSYVSGSDGVYRVTLPDTLSLSRGRSYTAKITADGGSGRYGLWYRPVIAEQRT